MAMAVLSSPPTRSHLSPTPSISTSHSSSTYTHHNRNPYPPSAISSRSKRNDGLLSLSVRASAENGAGFVTSSAAATTVNGVNASENSSVVTSKTKLKDNEDAGPKDESEVVVKKFADARWVSGNWDLKQFAKDGSTDWDAVIDAEARRRKWLEANPESSTNEDPVLFDSSIIPWWAWIKKFHLPEAELLNGRAAMVGFFMAYLVDSITGVGLVDQMGNFFCKTLLFVSVLGVLLVRKNEDLDNLKKLLEETTFYDKQWQATWQEEPTKKD